MRGNGEDAWKKRGPLRSPSITTLMFALCAFPLSLIAPPSSFLPRSSEVIFESDNIVLAEIAAALNFDEDECLAAGVFDAVRSAHGNVDALARRDDDFAIIKRHFRGTLHNCPVLGALRVLLVAQTLSR